MNIEKYNIEIDGRDFCDQPFNDLLSNMMKSEKYQ